MTLELRIPFEKQEDAREFQQYLKKNGCGSSLEGKFASCNVLCYEETIGDIEAFFNKIETWEKIGSSSDAKTTAIIEGRKWIENSRSRITELYEKCEVGIEYSRQHDIMENAYRLDLKLLYKSPYQVSDDERKRYEDLKKSTWISLCRLVFFRRMDVHTRMDPRTIFV